MRSFFEKKREQYPLYFSRFSMLIAVELIMAFSAMGYLVIPPISVTFMTLPVLAGALLFGPFEGMVMGAVFELTSLWKASTTALSAGDKLFSPFLSGEPAASLLLALGCRMAFGFVAGWLFIGAKKAHHFKHAAILAVSAFALFLHSLLVYATIQCFFPRINFTIIDALLKVLSLKSLLGWLIISLIVLVIYAISTSSWARMMRDRIYSIENTGTAKRIYYMLAMFSGIVAVLVFSLMFHFYTRADSILVKLGIFLPLFVGNQIFHLGLQFLIAVVSLTYVIVMIFLFYEKYANQMEERSEHDALTGLYNRRAMVSRINKQLETMDQKASGAFLIMDFDNFKQINDTYGHPFGDEVLKRFAILLQIVLPPESFIGRLGGDEFEAFIPATQNQAELEEIVDKIYTTMRTLRIKQTKHKPFSCSIGIVRCAGEINYDALYKKADAALYEVKQNGKNGYLIHP